MLVLLHHRGELFDADAPVAVGVHVTYDGVDALGETPDAAKVGEASADAVVGVELLPSPPVLAPAHVGALENAHELVLGQRAVVVDVEEPPREVYVVAASSPGAKLRQADDVLEDTHLTVAREVEELHEPREERVASLDVELARELAEVDVPVPVGVRLAIQLQHRADGAARASQSLRVEAGGGAVVREMIRAGSIRRGDEPAEGDIGRSPGDGDAPLASPPSASGQPRTFPSRRRPMSRRRSRSFPWWAPRGWTCRRCRRENSTRQRLRLWSSLGGAKL